jgi:glycosyltransferase involved in cell wall biosynthesis
VLIAPIVFIQTENHNFKSRNPLIKCQCVSIKKVFIENVLWIAFGIIIVVVKIDNARVIVTVLMVASNLEVYTISADNPAIKVEERKMKKKIKIGFFISNLPQGGAENQFVQLIKGINKQIFDVHVVLYAYQTEAFFIEIFSIKNISVTTNKLKYSFFLFKIIEALAYLKTTLSINKFDLVYTSLFMNGLFLRIVAPRHYKNKIVASMRNSIKSYSNFYLLAEKHLIKKSFLVFNSKSPLNDFKNISNEKFHNRLFSIYNGYNFNTDILTIKRINSKGVNIGALGRQTLQKNFIQLARVFIEIHDNKNKLIFQGNFADETNKINRLLENDFTKFEMRKPNPNIDTFFKDINILVLPSHYEGCPNVLFEAMIRKRICIVSNGANSDDFLIDGQSGFVYDGSDEGLLKSLKSAISIIGTKKEEEITNNAFNYASKNFSTEVMVNKYEELFKNIYEKNKSSN